MAKRVDPVGLRKKRPPGTGGREDQPRSTPTRTPLLRDEEDGPGQDPADPARQPRRHHHRPLHRAHPGRGRSSRRSSSSPRLARAAGDGAGSRPATDVATAARLGPRTGVRRAPRAPAHRPPVRQGQRHHPRHPRPRPAQAPARRRAPGHRHDLSAADARRLACNAAILPAVLDGTPCSWTSAAPSGSSPRPNGSPSPLPTTPAPRRLRPALRLVRAPPPTPGPTAAPPTCTWPSRCAGTTTAGSTCGSKGRGRPPVDSSPVRLVVARCQVDYAGRLTAHLPMATRVLMIKADGSVLVHSDGGSYKPLNWMSPPCTLREGTTEDGAVEWTVTQQDGRHAAHPDRGGPARLLARARHRPRPAEGRRREAPPGAARRAPRPRWPRA